MKKVIVVMCAAVLAGMAVMASPVFAEDAKPAAPALNADDLKKALGLSVYLQAGYTYNNNASDGELNDLRAFDKKANSFVLDLAEIVFAKDPASGAMGYKVKISAGETAKYIHSAGLVSSAGDDPFDITEASISYILPVGKGLRFDIGKMGTFIGAEVMEAIDDPNYSRSFLFAWAEPLTHTGVKMSYVFSDALNASASVVNGWDNSSDNNRGKSYGLSVGYTPVESFSLLVNGITGPEQDEQGPNAPTVGSSSSNKRSLLDVVATIKPVKPLSIILNTDNGREQNVPAGGPAEWRGYAGMVQ